MDGRVEFKYLVSNDLRDVIRRDLQPYVVTDALGGKKRDGEYTVRSIYYDTPQLECYDTKLDGLKVRNKFRIRGYDQPEADSLVFLEIKRKFNSFIAKHRAPLWSRDLEAFLTEPDVDKYILAKDSDDLRRDAQRFLYHYHRHRLVPAVLVVYDREAYQGRFDSSVRITFDKDLRRAYSPTPEMLYDERCLEPVMAHSFILEVKFFRCALPAFIRSIIRRYELPRMALSKYSTCLDSHPSIASSSPWRERLFAVGSQAV